ncbi:MAG: mnmH [Flaviaesturariibacter sp.]|nr:mnmH [Flaviaesturariibacter sp.]
MVSTRRLPLTEFLSRLPGALLVDVRSPGEFVQGHLPGAVSIPLFTDEERKVVGTAYKRESREAAIKIGLDYFGPKMRPIVEDVEQRLNALTPSGGSRPPVLLYCWRGGMRSGAIAWLLQLYGFDVTVLAGGYKAFRTYVVQTFALPFQFHVLGGYTGSGKTELLQRLREGGQTVIDLEAIAGHKGSAFGNIGLPPQPNQEAFENDLALALRAVHDKDPVWIEDESQRIGRLNLPHTLWNTIRRSPVFFLDIPFDQRLQHITEEYGALDRTSLGEATVRITKRLGGLQTKEALRHLDEGNLHACFSILLAYYDKHYGKALENREGWEALVTRIASDRVSRDNITLLTPLLQ